MKKRYYILLQDFRIRKINYWKYIKKSRKKYGNTVIINGDDIRKYLILKIMN